MPVASCAGLSRPPCAACKPRRKARAVPPVFTEHGTHPAQSWQLPHDALHVFDHFAYPLGTLLQTLPGDITNVGSLDHEERQMCESVAALAYQAQETLMDGLAALGNLLAAAGNRVEAATLAQAGNLTAWLSAANPENIIQRFGLNAAIRPAQGQVPIGHLESPTRADKVPHSTLACYAILRFVVTMRLAVRLLVLYAALAISALRQATVAVWQSGAAAEAIVLRSNNQWCNRSTRKHRITLAKCAVQTEQCGGKTAVRIVVAV